MFNIKQLFILLIIGVLASLYSCEKVIFLPYRGTIEGTVLDSQGKPIAGAQVTAFFFEATPEETIAQEISKTVEVAGEGYYYIPDVYNEVQLEVKAPGFRSQIRIVEIHIDERELEENFVLMPFDFAAIIEGVVKDNNGNLVTQGMINGTFQNPQSNSLETKTANISQSGTYRLLDVLNEVEIRAAVNGLRISEPPKIEVEQPGAIIQQDLTLEGSPTIQSVNNDKTSISTTLQDSLTVLVQVEDMFNSPETLDDNYHLHLLFFDSENELVRIASRNTGEVILEVTSQNLYLFQAILQAQDLPLGDYQVAIETIDDDGHQHLLEGAFGLSITE